MGNRAVITTKENFENNGTGVYLHWNGGRDSVEAFLKYCDLKGYRSPDMDNYGWARLVQVIANFFGGTLCVGVDTVEHLDCDNGDNGVYFIKGWEIVGRKYLYYSEQKNHDLREMLCDIDASMPIKEQLGKEYINAPVVKTSDLQVGDKVAYIGFDGHLVHETVVGIGEDRTVFGRNVKGIPFVARYDNIDHPEDNLNNYLLEKEYRKIG